MELSAEERRVLGCLIEKQATTPDQYPLSTNALVNACNQKSNRDPVVEYGERTVMEATLRLRQAGLARMNSSGRTDKHRHIADDALGLDHDQLALLAIMLLRGPQSPGELRTRTERYPTSQGFGFESLDDIEAVLSRLAEGTDPLVANIGRAPGQSQDRWSHLLGDDGADDDDRVGDDRGRVGRDDDGARAGAIRAGADSGVGDRYLGDDRGGVDALDVDDDGAFRPRSVDAQPSPNDTHHVGGAVEQPDHSPDDVRALTQRVIELEARLAALEDALGVEPSPPMSADDLSDT